MRVLMIAFVLFAWTAPSSALANPGVDFNAKCATCHRANANLLKKAKSLKVDPRKLTLRTSRMTRDGMIAITEKGKDKMPAFEGELTRQQIEDIVDYVIALKNRKK